MPDSPANLLDEVVQAVGTVIGGVHGLALLAVRPNWSRTFKGRLGQREVLIKASRNLRPTREQAELELQDVVSYIAAEQLASPLSLGERYLTVRKFQRTLLSDSIDGSGTATLNAADIKWRTVVMRDVIRGIAELHTNSMIHGDIRPDNISVRAKGSAELLDFGSPIPTSLLTPIERRYRAPEGTRTQASDLYSVGQLFEELILRGVHPDEQLPVFNLNARQLAWIADICRSDSARDRPTAEALLELISGNTTALTRRAAIALRGARRDLVRAANTTAGQQMPFAEIDSFAMSVEERALSSLFTYRETSLALFKPRAARAVMALLPIDKVTAVVHTHQHERAAVSAEFITQHPKSIDDDWDHRLISYARQFERDHPDDARVILEDSRDFAERIRAQLLAQTHYFDDDGLSRLMSRPGIEVAPESVSVLRQWKYLFAVPDHGRWLYPDFQFEPQSGAPYELVHDVGVRFSDDESPWTQLSWWTSPHPLLDDESPSKALADPQKRLAILEALEFSIS